MKKYNLLILIILLNLGLFTEFINGKFNDYSTFDIVKIIILAICLIFSLYFYKRKDSSEKS
jgi:ABC-type transport system involved in multi-copper enzyme maturation permease subunit